MEFDIPLALTDLETAPAREGALFPKDVQDVSSMRDVEANELVERLTHDLCDNDATCIMEQEIFDRAYVCVRDFHRLSVVARIRLCDALCSNLSVLSSAAHTMLAAGAGADGADAVASHREALKCYSTLVYHLAKGAEADAAPSAAAAPLAGAARAAAEKACAARSFLIASVMKATVAGYGCGASGVQPFRSGSLIVR